jgi:hypothetical protein
VVTHRISAGVLLVPLMLVGAAVFYVAGRGLSFYFDEWSFILLRQQNTAGAFLDAHNGHLTLLSIVTYKALWSTVGLRHYGPYRLVDIALHLTCVALFFVYIRRRVGDRLALPAAVLLLFLGRAWQDIIWPFQIVYLGSLAAGTAMLLLLEERRPRDDGFAAFCLAVSLAWSGLGISFVVGGLVALLITRSPWQRYWVVAAPLVLYLLWYSRYGESEARVSNIVQMPRYVFESYAGAVGALSGTGLGVGRALGILTAVACVGLAIARRPSADVLIPTATLASFWVLTALSRAQYHEPAASRYLYPGVLLLLMIFGHLVGKMEVSRTVFSGLWLLVGVSIALNLYVLRDSANWLRNNDGVVNAELGAMELERAHVPAGFQPDAARAPQIAAGPYFAVTRVLGSPAVGAAQLAHQAPSTRLAVDAVLVATVRDDLLTRGTPAQGGSAVTVEGFGVGRLERSGSCIAFVPQAHPPRPPAVDVEVPRTGLGISSPRPISLYPRRFADDYEPASLVAAGAGSYRLKPPPDKLNVPWHVRIAPAGPVRVCTASPQ